VKTGAKKETGFKMHETGITDAALSQKLFIPKRLG
jgi:hypothetical protein